MKYRIIGWDLSGSRQKKKYDKIIEVEDIFELQDKIEKVEKKGLEVHYWKV